MKSHYGLEAIAGSMALLSACGGGSDESTTTAQSADAASVQAASATTVAALAARGGYTSAPVVGTQPASVSVTPGASASFSVVAYGAPTLSYQWRKNGVAIAGATAATFTISSTTASDASSYDVVVSNSAGAATSNTASLTVGSTTTASCDTAYVDSVLGAITAFKTALGTSLSAATQYDASAYTAAQMNVYKTNWTNLPAGAVPRPGITLGQVTTAAQIAAFNTLARTALSTAGYADFQGVLAADDYLGYTLNANGYGADLYHVAVIGTPSQTGVWTLMFGGHHMAFNLNFNSACSYPTPHHIGVEPRTAFTSNNHTSNTFYSAETYTVLAAKAAAMGSVFSSLSSNELSSAFLTGQKFSDVLIGPVEATTGSYANVTTKFNAVAASSNRGVLVSSLSSAAQALVSAAISQYVADYDSTTATRLLADYQAGYASTYVAWANAAGAYSSSGPDVTANGTYLRIEGSRVWIEIAVQNGIVVQNQTHYHMIYRDKTYDYFDRLGS